MKTLMNCKLSEFLRQTNAIRHSAAEFFNLIDIETTRKEFAEKYKESDDKSKASMEYVSTIMDKLMDENADATVDIIGKIAFMSKYEAEMLEPDVALDILYDALCSERVMNFFISAVRLVLGDSDSITQMLISAKSKFSERNTSGSQSQISTENTQNE